MQHCQLESNNTCHHLVLITSLVHCHLTLPRPLTSKFHTEDSRITQLSLINNTCIALLVEPHTAKRAISLHSLPCMFCLAPLSYNLHSLLLLSFSAQLSTSTLLHISLFSPSQSSKHEHCLRLGIAHAVVPLNIHLLPPSKQYQLFPGLCRHVGLLLATIFPILFFILLTIICSILVSSTNI